MTAPDSAMRPNKSAFSGGNTMLMPVPSTATVRPFAASAPWCDAVSMPRAPPLTTVTPHMPVDRPACARLDAVMRRHARADHARRFILRVSEPLTYSTAAGRRFAGAMRDNPRRFESKRGSRNSWMRFIRRRGQRFSPSRQSPRRFRRRCCGLGAVHLGMLKILGASPKCSSSSRAAHRPDVAREIKRDERFP